MDRSKTSLRVKEFVADELVRNLAEIKDSSTLESLGADSLDVVELILNIEKEFEIEVLDEDVEKLATVGELIDYIQKKVK